jgi:DNA-binding transcriptional ArsR family regulator
MPPRNGTGLALLADPTRLRIVALVAVAPSRPSVIAAELGLSRPAVSQQLRLLERGGLVVRNAWLVDRRSFLYRLNPRAVGPIVAWLAGTGVAHQADPRVAVGRIRPGFPSRDRRDTGVA